MSTREINNSDLNKIRRKISNIYGKCSYSKVEKDALAIEKTIIGSVSTGNVSVPEQLLLNKYE